MARATASNASDASEASDASHDWLRRSGALTVAPPRGWPSDEVATATGTAHRLVDLARRLVAAGAVSDDCSGPSCAFGCLDEGGDRPCELTWDLACTPIPSSAAPDQDVITALVDGYLRALCEAGSAVFVCRRTLHTSGDCLFQGGGTGIDLCGRVLAMSHRLSGRPRR